MNKMIYEMNHILNWGYEIMWSYVPRSHFMNVILAIDLFTDKAAILISIVSNSYYGMPRGQIHINLPPGHPIIAIRNNRNQNGRLIGKKVY